jgi:hypothetical protein
MDTLAVSTHFVGAGCTIIINYYLGRMTLGWFTVDYDDAKILKRNTIITRICMWGPSAEMDPTPGMPYPLELYGSIDTAHRQNIFDLKYIPHANHPTIVSVAGDSRILVYDVERLPKTTEALETPVLDGRVRSAVTKVCRIRLYKSLHC